MPIWGIQVMGDHHERADGHPGRPRACGRWRGVRADHGSAQPPACTHPGWGWGGGEQPEETHQQAHPRVGRCYCRASATQAAAGLPWEEGASDREEDGGQAHPPRGSRTADRTRPQLTATGKASAQDARTLRKTQGLWEGGESNTPLDLCCSQGPAMRRRSETQRCCCC